MSEQLRSQKQQISSRTMTRVAVYYDLYYFTQVYKYMRDNRTGSPSFSVSCFNELLMDEAARRRKIPKGLLNMVSCWGFCGSFDAHRLVCTDTDMSTLIREFDDERYQVHYEPYQKVENRYVEKGVDVALTCSVYQHKSEFDMLILVTNDGDFVPLVKDMKDLGKEVVIPQWSYNWMERIGTTMKPRMISPSVRLRQSATTSLDMMKVLYSDRPTRHPFVDRVFMTS